MTPLASPAMLEGWFFIAAGLLIVSGGAKIRDPEPTRGALRAASLPSSGAAVLVLALTEIAIGALALVEAGRLGGTLLGIIYLGFAGFVARALTAELPIQSCGCFGRADTPPTPTHLVVNLLTAITAGAVALTDRAGLATSISEQPAAGIPYVGFLGIGVFCLALVLTELPAVWTAARRP